MNNGNRPPDEADEDLTPFENEGRKLVRDMLVIACASPTEKFISYDAFVTATPEAQAWAVGYMLGGLVEGVVRAAYANHTAPEIVIANIGDLKPH